MIQCLWLNCMTEPFTIRTVSQITKRYPSVLHNYLISLKIHVPGISDQDYRPACTSSGHILQQTDGRNDGQSDSYIPPQQLYLQVYNKI